MGGSIHKIPTTCPHCGHSQPEPSAAQSTYCRGCGDHYRIERGGFAVAAITHAPVQSMAARFGGALFRPKRRKLDCRTCGRIFSVLATGSSVANCPTCGTLIEMADIHVAANSSRCIDTRGTVFVARDAFLNSVDIRCGALICDGRVSGRIQCAGTVRLGGTGICHAQIYSDAVVIEKAADLRLPYPVHAREITIIGKLEADLAPSQRVTIRRRGSLVGNVETRSMVVDRGGLFSGDVRVCSTKPRPAAASCQDGSGTASAEKPPIWQSQLAFG